MRVELLFWAGCPSHEKALQELRAVLAEEGLDPLEVVVREIDTESGASAERFVGSPTVRVDGVEVQPAPNEPAALTCRVYTRRDGRISPTPDPEDIRDLVRRAHANTSARAALPAGASAPARGDSAPARADSAPAHRDSAPASGDSEGPRPDAASADADSAPAMAARGAR
jgi:hypothetical protein